MSFEYFIIFGTVPLVIAVLAYIIFRIVSQISDLRYELKIGKINCQRDLNRLEEKLDKLSNKSTSNEQYSNDIERLDKLVKNLHKLVDSRIDDTDTIKRLLKD
jgi:predicted PurR-regulated permease PerM